MRIANKMAHCLKNTILFLALLVIVLSVMDIIYLRESVTDIAGLGLWHLSSTPGLKSLSADGTVASGRETGARSNEEASTESYIPYDAIHVAPNWTCFDVKHLRNNHRAPISKMLEKLNYTHGEFPHILLNAPSAIHLSGSVSNSTRNTAMLIYNRVPKCGSRTLLEVLAMLSQLNGFSYSHGVPMGKHTQKATYHMIQFMSMPTDKVLSPF